MYLHEYQSKALLAAAGVAVPRGGVAFDGPSAQRLAESIPASRWAVKSQAHTGGRGKAGGIRLEASPGAVAAATESLIGRQLVTVQTGPSGLPVRSVLIEEVRPPQNEYYLCLLVDRTTGHLQWIASASGGTDIEEIAQTDPDRIVRLDVPPATGFEPYQARVLLKALGLALHLLDEFSALMRALERLALDKDLLQIEINPLAVDDGGHFYALDVKITADDNALGLHADLEALRDPEQEDVTEARARDLGLSFVKLDGNIGCMVNGAGLAMATLDVIGLYGGRAANFLDVGGGITRDRVVAAFDLILSEPRVKTILVNIFGGIVRCDLIAEGLIEAVRATGLQLPLIVRLEGTRAEEGLALLEASGLSVIGAKTLDEAALKAVERSR